jgi:UDP-N-acetylmuramoyl-L-alanyl-D-glutamate--2,6-diaminopimelate ligase
MAFLAAWYYGFPASKMIVIGVTGTSGKTSAIEFISKVLENAGYKVGYTSTAKWKIAEKEVLNNKKMTMLGRFQTHRLLDEMVKAGCQYAIVETTSEGIRQFRTSGIHYDTVIITNLYPEHIEAHGSFENYKSAKLELFKKLANSKHKILNGIKIPKISIANFDDEHCYDFLRFKVDQKYLFGINNKADLTNSQEVRAEQISYSKSGTNFKVKNQDFKLNILGEHNIYNSLIGVCVGLSQNISLPDISSGIALVKKIEGRLEKIEAGQDFTVIVDYAFEPNAVTKLYETIKKFNVLESGKKIIHVFGSTGGGRDKARRPILGKIVAQNADILIITNEDPYDEDPQVIIDDVAKGVETLKIQNSKFKIYKILDRREAIKKALSLAQVGDLVLVTGKGSEQAIAVASEQLIPWDDRKVVREEIAIKKMSVNK